MMKQRLLKFNDFLSLLNSTSLLMHRYLIEFARFKLHGTLNNDYGTENNLITVFRSLIYVN